MKIKKTTLKDVRLALKNQKHPELTTVLYNLLKESEKEFLIKYVLSRLQNSPYKLYTRPMKIMSLAIEEYLKTKQKSGIKESKKVLDQINILDYNAKIFKDVQLQFMSYIITSNTLLIFAIMENLANIDMPSIDRIPIDSEKYNLYYNNNISNFIIDLSLKKWKKAQTLKILYGENK